MTALPYDPRHLYTVAEFAALPEDPSARYELQEGAIVVSPRAAPLHNRVQTRLIAQLDAQVEAGLVLLGEIDVDLGLPYQVVRIPDLVVTRAAVALAEHGLTKASDVVLAVEIQSPSSVHTDGTIKLMEYADAGIPNYWLIDPEPPVTATVYYLVDGEYEESQRADGVFAVSDPCPLTVDLDALLPPS
ncbi:MAG: Uma2 family endonuclease [Thermocrispum sp.]